MKKLMAVILSLVLVMSLAAGCGKKAATTDNNTNANTNTNQTETKKYTDGTYKAAFDFIDGHGWKPTLEITIKDGKIEKAVFDYVNPEGKLKTQDAAYNTAMKAKNGTSPAEYSPKLGDNLVKSQDAATVEGVTGATSSSNNFKALATAILEKAAKGDTSETILPMNDTYTATEKDFDEHGYKASVAVTYENGKITKVAFDEVDKNGKKKSENTEYNTQMKAKSGVSAVEASEKLVKTYMETGKVEVVTGATGISTKFKTLLEQALAMRK